MASLIPNPKLNDAFCPFLFLPMVFVLIRQRVSGVSCLSLSLPLAFVILSQNLNGFSCLFPFYLFIFSIIILILITTIYVFAFFEGHDVLTNLLIILSFFLLFCFLSFFLSCHLRHHRKSSQQLFSSTFELVVFAFYYYGPFLRNPIRHQTQILVKVIF
jgi:hypothetical protein